jgi:hypothetical protein
MSRALNADPEVRGVAMTPTLGNSARARATRKK